MPVDASLRALAHPARRQVLALCGEQERSVNELAEALALRQSSTSQHLRVLRDAGLLRARADGNRRLYCVDFERLAAVRAVIDSFWSAKLPALKRAAEARARRRP